MSEQRSYMAELDLWTEANVIGPLLAGFGSSLHADPAVQIVDQVKRAIRRKVLESFRNGLKAPQRARQRGGEPYGR